MADEPIKWTVTYTNQVKQKRKVYHDGYLLLHSSNKVMLCDDTEKMLAEKFLKGDEKLSSGKSLTFSSYLVDIGDSENDEKTKKSSGPDISCTPGRKKVSFVNISPSRKAFKEFKQHEKVKQVLKERSPISTSTVAGEWQALYTTQLTQKAKKYHDGFLKLFLSGSQGRQAKLYDESKTHLTSKFLKKEENICSGQSVKFDGYLIDIGDPVNQGNAEIVIEEGEKCSTSEKPRAVSRKRFLHNSFSNDGVSSSKDRKSPQGYVTAYALFKKGNPPNEACLGKAVEQNLNLSVVNAAKIGSTEPAAPNMSLRGGNSSHDASSEKYVKQKLNSSSAVNTAKVGLTEIGPPNMSLRGANQILSFLKKPTSPRSNFITEQAPGKECCPSPDLPMLDTDYEERFDGSVRQESEDRVPQHEGLTQPNPKSVRDAESRHNPSEMFREIKIEKDSDDDICVLPRSSSAAVFSSSIERPTPSHQGLDKITAIKTTCGTHPVISSAPEARLPLADLENLPAQESRSSKGKFT